MSDSVEPVSTPIPDLPLGATGIRVSPLGIGAWAWGDRMFWGYGRGYAVQDVRDAFETALAAGINFFDTAEVYAQGQSERMLGKYVREFKQPVVVATKFAPFPWRLGRGSLLRALRGSLKRLGLPKVDLYQIHWPVPTSSVQTWAGALADAVEAGLTRAVGVSNYTEEQMRTACSVLSQRGIPLATNQVEYSLLNRKVEKNGLLRACQDLNITLIAYSPLLQGVLSGKYTPRQPLTGFRGRKYSPAFLEKTAPLIRLLRDVGDALGKTPAQVALNWTICKGTLPIPGAKNARQAQENAGALGWQLTDEDVARLEEMSDRVLA